MICHVNTTQRRSSSPVFKRNSNLLVFLNGHSSWFSVLILPSLLSMSQRPLRPNSQVDKLTWGHDPNRGPVPTHRLLRCSPLSLTMLIDQGLHNSSHQGSNYF